jgi:hypothetical protein
MKAPSLSKAVALPFRSHNGLKQVPRKWPPAVPSPGREGAIFIARTLLATSVLSRRV